MATILIIDDVEDNRNFLVTVLRGQGHRLHVAADGLEGLATFRAATPELVITDVLMPVMDGYEFVRHLRREPAGRLVPVLFYTAKYGSREANELARDDGVIHVLTKPATSDEVLALVAEALGGNGANGSRKAVPLSAAERHQLRLLPDTPTDSAGLRTANARLRALINIVLEFAGQRDSSLLLNCACSAARDLFGASYVTIGILNRGNATVQKVVSCGQEHAPWIEPGSPLPGVLARVVKDHRTVRGTNPGGVPGNLGLPPSHPPVEAFLAGPIPSTGHVYGWICLVNNEGRTFTAEDESLVVALSGLVGRVYEREDRARERKEAVAALRRERHLSQSYLDTAQAILLALDVEGRITLVNRYACSVLGWAHEDLVGRDWIDTCCPPRIRDELRATLQRFVRDAHGNGSETLVRSNAIQTRTGEERIFEWRGTILRNDAGVAVGTFSSGTDITTQSEAVANLRTAEERMRFAMEVSGAGVWEMNYATGELWCSPALVAQYGLQPGEFGGTIEALMACVHPEDREALAAQMSEANRLGTDLSVQYRTLWPDGTVHWLSGTGRVMLDAEGAPRSGVGISLDITARRMLEDQVQQALKMEAIGRLAGGVAHDFNNSLTGILGYCDLLLTDLPPDDSRHGDIVEIQKAGAHAAALTRQLLAFSRKQIIEPTLLDLNEVVAGMRGMLARLIGEDIRVVLELADVLALVKADRSQIEQIILNLAVNARDAMPSGGTLTIATANMALDRIRPQEGFHLKPGAYVAMTVTDTGSGMSTAVKERMFEPFFTTKEIGKGTGLGLATVHGIVEQSGGGIRVHSAVGEGTTLRICFPVAAPSGALQGLPALTVTQPDARTHTVLVVEDADGLRGLVKRLLSRSGNRVMLAVNAEEALALFAAHPEIDLLLTDVVMPGTSGPTLARSLLAIRPGLRVIYMSGYTEEFIVQDGVLDPGIVFLHKPFTSESLARKISEVFDPGRRRELVPGTT
jgi:two-component system cell cycle sensor histidine kinase/response regulator CckA